MIGKIVFALIDLAFGVAMAADQTAHRAKRLSRVLRRRDSEPAADTQRSTSARRPGETLRPPPPRR